MALYTKIKGPINYTAIGTLPTISDGIASNFTTTSGLMTDTDLIDTENWEMQIKFYNTETSSNYIMLIGTRGFGMDFVIASSRKASVYLSSTGSSWNYASNVQGTYSIPTNQWIYYKLIKTSLLFQAYYSLDGLNWTKDIEISMPVKLGYSSATYAKRVAIGYLNESNSHPFLGQIDLNETYINVDGTAWFGKSFSKVKVKSGLARYTVVGSPTIINGVVSNFSSANYLTIPGKIYFGNTIEISGKITTGSDLTSDERCIFQGTTSAGSNIYFYYHNVRKALVLYTGSSGTYIVGSTEFSTSTTYYFKVIYTPIDVKVYIGTDKNNLTLEMSSSSIPTSSDTYIQSLVLGKYTSPAHPWNGSFDLNEWSIKINNGYYWRGAYQNINAWKIQQDNFSKYYTIVDGKLMWASPDIYLRNTDANYIDTRVIQTNNTRTIIKASRPLDATVDWPQLMGGVNGTGQKRIFYNKSSVAISGRYYDNRDLSTLSVGNIFIVDYNKNTLSIVNGSSLTTTAATFTDTQTAWIFNSHGVSQYPYHGDIYYSKFYENDVLIRHFVPVPKGLLIGNFVVPGNGMFDIVEQKFYGNVGTGEFTIGGIPEDYIIEGGKLIWCRDDIYLQNTSSWTAWINTGIIPTDDMRFQTLSEVTDSASHDGCLLGCRVNSSSGTTGKQFVLWYGNYSGNINSGSFVYGGNASGNCNFNLGTLQKTQLNYDGTYFYCNGTSITPGSSNVNKSNFSSTLPIYLFGFSANGSIESRRFHGKVYEVALWSGSTILQYLVPVPKGMLIGDKIAPSNCMFDIVTQTFFENQGTGEFVYGGLGKDLINVGNNIVWTDENVYLQFNGAQYIDTGFKANQNTSIRFEYTPTSASGDRGLYCSRDGRATNSYTMFNLSAKTRFDYNTSLNNLSDASITVGTRRKVYSDKNKCYIDDTLKYTATYANFQSNYNLLLGCSYVAASSSQGTANYNQSKYHYVELYDNSKLIRYFLPVNTDTVIGSFTVSSPGMWDAVTRKFYPNKGTGTFTYGKDS